jgi:hypothetical protein
MRPDIVPGVKFPDYELPDHTAKHSSCNSIANAKSPTAAAHKARSATGTDIP